MPTKPQKKKLSKLRIRRTNQMNAKRTRNKENSDDVGNLSHNTSPSPTSVDFLEQQAVHNGTTVSASTSPEGPPSTSPEGPPSTSPEGPPNTSQPPSRSHPECACAVRGCASTSRPGLLFYPLPENERRCAHWLRVMGRAELAVQDAATLHEAHRVCGLHFAPDHLVNGTPLEGAVPTLLLPTSAVAPKPRQRPANRNARNRGTQTDAALAGVVCVSCRRGVDPRTLRPLTRTLPRCSGDKELAPRPKKRRALAPSAPVTVSAPETVSAPADPEPACWAAGGEPLVDVADTASGPPAAVFVYEYCPTEPPPEPEDTLVVKMEPEDDIETVQH